MSDRQIPLGISVISILMFIGAILEIAAGVFLLIETSEVADIADVAEATITGMAIGLIVTGVIIGLLAYGLRSGSNGVRLLIGVVMALRIFFSIYAIIALPALRFEGLATGVIAIVVLYLLYGDEQSKAFFEGRLPAA
mgnify:FL=1